MLGYFELKNLSPHMNLALVQPLRAQLSHYCFGILLLEHTNSPTEIHVDWDHY